MSDEEKKEFMDKWDGHGFTEYDRDEYGYLHPYTDVELIFDWIEQHTAKRVQEAIGTSKVTRLEVIDENGRSYVNWKPGNKIELSFQDAMRTLKIFVSKLTT